MTKIRRAIIFIIIFLQPLQIFCQNQDSLKKITIAKRLTSSAGTLFGEDENSRALDSLFEALKYRQDVYGDKSPELYNNYNLIGLIYGKIGQLNQSLRYYILAEECSLLKEEENINQLASVYNNIGNIYIQKLDYSNIVINTS